MAASAGATLPFSWYVDEEILRRERALIFARSWQYAGRAAQVAAPGSFLATDENCVDPQTDLPAPCRCDPSATTQSSAATLAPLLHACN